MRPEVFLRAEKKLKKVAITDTSKPMINDQFIDKWQDLCNITAELIGITAVLIMKITSDSMEVFLSNENDENPYNKGDCEKLGHGLYCETVIGKNKKLFVKNALESKTWQNNPDVQLNMISYYGLPVNWPDGKTFGTICILDDTEINLDENQIALFESYKELVEKDLALLVNQEKLNNLINIDLDLLCIINNKGIFLEANSAWEELLGYSLEGLKNKKFYHLIHKADQNDAEQAIKKCKSNKIINSFVCRIKDATGKFYFIEWHIQLKNQLIYLTGRDITESLLQKKKIENQKKRLDWIIEGIDAGTWEWNIQTDKTVYNEQWAMLLGYTLDEISPTTIETWKKYTHPDDLERAEKNLKKHFNGETKIYDVPMRMQHKDGHWIWVNARGRVMSFTEDNQPLKMFGIHVNITKRKEKEKKLKETQKLLKKLTDQAPGVIHQFKLSPDGTFSFPYVSKGVYEIYEVKPEELVDDATEAFINKIHPDDYEEVVNSIKASALDLSPWKIEFRVNLPKQGLKWVEGDSIPEKQKDGSIIWYGSLRDITKQKRYLLFQETLAEISSNLLMINASNVDRRINDALEKIGLFFGMDRSYIFRLFDNKEMLSNTHEWCDNGIVSQKEMLQYLEFEKFTWGKQALSENKIIHISDVEAMKGNQKTEKRLLQSLNLKSVVAVPIFIENQLFGFFGFDAVKTKREFSEEDLRLLKIFTDVITSAFSKYVNDNKILKLTYNDSLTGLYNRRFFEKELLRLDTQRQLPISIIIGDINGLKIINDSLGHEKGDELLIKSANILKNIIREEDVLARQGGDEFSILLPKTTKNAAENIINRIKQVSKVTKSDELTVSMALGVATKTKIEENIYDILKQADNNMYQNKLSESKSTKSKIVKSLLTTLEVKSYETKEHAMRMTELSIAFGEALGLSNNELNRLSLLSTLHDIGKTTIPEGILKKPGALTQEEWQLIKKHTERGYRIANSSQEFALVAEEIYSHHEMWSGEGYPRQLKGKEIPYLARIISIIDAYDVMTHERPYKHAISKREALKEIDKCAGSQFDPDLAESFIKMMKKQTET
jgi:diguanylate cyclase (GGDEF)-like protein/PAS domain S-box-containing protein